MNSKNYLDKLIKTVYSKWLTEKYGISNTPVKLEGCDLKKYYLKLQVVKKEYETKISLE